MGLFKGGVLFALGAASGIAAHRMLRRYSKETGKDGAQLLVQGVGAALAAGREMTRKAARFMEEVEDAVAEAQAGMANGAQATATASATGAQEPATPPNGAERV